MNSTEQIQLYLSLFKGREDAFAIRWEKEGKSGYMPAYDFNWNEFSQHKANGGTLKDFQNKQFSKLTQQRVLNHLNGKEVIGLYPLLTNNSSWFIVADFDETLSCKRSWIEECRLFLNVCEKYRIPAYLERSRSGKGGHVWIFFCTNYPASKSRLIILKLLEVATILSPFDKNSNYDRLFPNQDYHSGKGLGNLIALPLQNNAMLNGNSCFIDINTQMSFDDQWTFLANIKRTSTSHLDLLFYSFVNFNPAINYKVEKKVASSGEVLIVLDAQVTLSRSQLNPVLISFLREHLNFVNSEYIIKKKLGKSTFGTEPYFRMLSENEDNILLPRGFTGKLIRFCKEEHISYRLVDKRKKLTELDFSFKGSLYEHQERVVEAANKKEIGIIVSPPGTGKTIIGLAIIAQKKQPALIIVHRKQLFHQWIERIESFLGIANAHIGKIASAQQKTGTHITVAMIQSLASVNAASEIFNSFGTIIIDECHHVPAKTFRQVISRFSSYYLYGLTATPLRKNNDEKLIFIHIGDIIHEVKPAGTASKPESKISVIIRETQLFVPFNYMTDKPETLNQILIHDTSRNQLIVEDIKSEVNTGKRVLVLTERKAHMDLLYQYLKNSVQVIMISGEDTEPARKVKLKQIKEGNFQALIATGQFFGEGTDIDNLDCLVLAYPFSFEGKLVQYMGRVQRSEITPVIYDYRDIYIDYLEQQFRQRNRHYRKLMNAGLIQKFDDLVLMFEEDRVLINSDACTLPISCLDFPMEVVRFKAELAWRVRVLKYDEERGELMTEIMDYNAKPIINATRQAVFQFLIIDKIKFRSIDTMQLLSVVELGKSETIRSVAEESVVDYEILKSVLKPLYKPVEGVLLKTMKIPFDRIQFLNACVSFPVFVEELGQEIVFEIKNPDIRPEFEAIKDYFGKVLKKKLINTQLEIRFSEKKIISAIATSEDIKLINGSIIDTVRFELVKKQVIGFKGKDDKGKVLNTLNDLLVNNRHAINILKSDEDLVNDILTIKNSKHYHQLKYLASQHQSSILKLRFILEPFSFLFLLAGDKKYHLVWETLNSEEATYIWHFDKAMETLRNGLKEIETVLNEIKVTGKQEYLKKEHDNFSRVMHDYSDVQSGFVIWKGILEVKLV